MSALPTVRPDVSISGHNGLHGEAESAALRHGGSVGVSREGWRVVVLVSHLHLQGHGGGQRLPQALDMVNFFVLFFRDNYKFVMMTQKSNGSEVILNFTVIYSWSHVR